MDVEALQKTQGKTTGFANAFQNKTMVCRRQTENRVKIMCFAAFLNSLQDTCGSGTVSSAVRPCPETKSGKDESSQCCARSVGPTSAGPTGGAAPCGPALVFVRVVVVVIVVAVIVIVVVVLLLHGVVVVVVGGGGGGAVALVDLPGPPVCQGTLAAVSLAGGPVH